MNETIQEKRSRLEREIEFAKAKLLQNIEEFSPINSLIDSDPLMPLVNKVLNNPTMMINTVDTISRSLLPEESWIRRVLKIYKSIVSGMRLLQSS